MVQSKSKSESNKDSGKNSSKEGAKSKGVPVVVSKLSNLKELLKYYDLPLEDITITTIAHKMIENTELYLKILQQLMQPEEFHSVYECNAFSDKEKAELFGLYKRIIIVNRELLNAIILMEDDNFISTIKFAHEELSSLKPKMSTIVKKMRDSWTKPDVQGVGPKQYFG